jgi:hypothetical protein
VLTNFFRPENAHLFLGVITQGNNVYHYSDKGAVTLKLNLEQRCGSELRQSHMIYDEECLVLVAGGELTALHRQSYYKKCVIAVSEAGIVRVRRVVRDDWSGLICFDSECQVYLIDVSLRQAKVISHTKAPLCEEFYQFNKYLIYRQGEQVSKLILLKTGQEKTIRTDLELYFFSIIGEQLIRISKASGKLALFAEQKD